MGDQVDVYSEFQSLFLWKVSADRASELYDTQRTLFQSLFLWKVSADDNVLYELAIVQKFQSLFLWKVSADVPQMHYDGVLQ